MKLKDPLGLKLTISKKKSILKMVLNSHMRYIALTIILMFVTGIAGYTIGNLKPILKGPISQLAQNSNIKTETKDSPLFETQSATVIGTITAINGNVLTVTDGENQTDQFTVSEGLLIFKASLRSPSSSPSADIKSVELNKRAIITLDKKGEGYEIISIRYIPDPNSVPTAER